MLSLTLRVLFFFFLQENRECIHKGSASRPLTSAKPSLSAPPCGDQQSTQCRRESWGRVAGLILEGCGPGEAESSLMLGPSVVVLTESWVAIKGNKVNILLPSDLQFFTVYP